MAITCERLRQTFSEGGAQEIYREIKATGGFLGFAQWYVFDPDYRVARSALWVLTKDAIMLLQGQPAKQMSKTEF